MTSPERAAAADDSGLERTLLILGLISALQMVKTFVSPDHRPWVFGTRVVLGVLGVAFLYLFHAQDVGSFGSTMKGAVRFAVGLAVLLLFAVWIF